MMDHVNQRTIRCLFSGKIKRILAASAPKYAQRTHVRPPRIPVNNTKNFQNKFAKNIALLERRLARKINKPSGSKETVVS